MKLQTLPVSISLATLIGAVHRCLIIWAWQYIVIHSPLTQWLLSHGITGATFWSSVFIADFLIHTVLCIPAAYLLCKLRPANLSAYLLAAVLPGFIWEYQLVLGDITLPRNWLMLLPGALLATLPLPVTSLIIRKFVADSPNISFKPKPLRGSA